MGSGVEETTAAELKEEEDEGKGVEEWPEREKQGRNFVMDLAKEEDAMFLMLTFEEFLSLRLHLAPLLIERDSRGERQAGQGLPDF